MEVPKFYFIKCWSYTAFKSELESVEKQWEELDLQIKEIKSARSKEVSELSEKEDRVVDLDDCLCWRKEMLYFLDVALRQVETIAGIRETSDFAEEEKQLDKLAIQSLQLEIKLGLYYYSQSQRKGNALDLIEQVRMIEEEDELVKQIEERCEVKEQKKETWDTSSSIRRIKLQIDLLNSIPATEVEQEHKELAKETQDLKTKVKQMLEEINDLSQTLKDLSIRKSELQQMVKEMTAQNEIYEDILTTARTAKELAKKKDVAGLEKLSRDKTNEFVSWWKKEARLRMIYEKAFGDGATCNEFKKRRIEEKEEPNI